MIFSRPALHRLLILVREGNSASVLCGARLCWFASGRVGAPHIKVAVLEAGLPSVERIKRLCFVLFHRSNGFLKHSFGFLWRAEVSSCQ